MTIITDIHPDVFAHAVDYEHQRAEAEARGLLVPAVAPETYVHLENVAAATKRLRMPRPSFDADRVSLVADQTPIRNQELRGTCYAFAGIAALEAAYKRRYGLELDLSEQYLFQAQMLTDLIPGVAPPPIETGTSLHGARGNSEILDGLMRIAVPTEHEAPYLARARQLEIRRSIPAAGAPSATDDGWFASQEALDAFELSDQVVPLAARWNARYKVRDANVLPGPMTIERYEAALRTGREVVVDVPNHCMLLIGYDRGRREWLFKNSWGGDQWTVYSYDQTGLMSFGTYIVDVAPPDRAPDRHAWWVGRWNMDHDGWRGTLVIRRFTNRRDTAWTDDYGLDRRPTKLGDWYAANGQRRDVHGWFEDDGQHLVFFIAPDSNRRPPGTLDGQRFDVYVFSWDQANVAGWTTWSGIPFGATLSRWALPAVSPPSGGFNVGIWNGRWQMNHDGWRGVLSVWDARADGAVQVAYEPAGGGRIGGRARLDGTHRHVMDCRLEFPSGGQDFRLLLHTRDCLTLSGTTNWGGRTFGVQGRRG